jgi:hypothetical protein
LVASAVVTSAATTLVFGGLPGELDIKKQDRPLGICVDKFLLQWLFLALKISLQKNETDRE